ncbi:MAG: PilN domain-containing protein [Alphaproteobacteria bacterium]
MIKKENIKRSIEKSWALTQAAGQWWLSEMSAMIPKDIKERLTPPTENIIISFENADAVVRRFDAQGSTVIRRESLKALEAMDMPLLPSYQTASIALPSENAFIDNFKVPVSARAKLHQAVSFEVKRRSPFRSDDALFDFSAVNNPDRQTLNVEWATIPANLIQRGKIIAQKLGYLPVAVGIAANTNKNLKYVFDRQKHSSPFRLDKPLAIMLLSFALFICVAIYAISARSGQVTEINREVSTLKAEAKQAGDTKAAVDKRLAALSLVASRTNEPKVLGILREVTNLMPNDTWVAEFNLKGNQLELIGYSAAASSLIERFATVPLFDHAHFRAPITPQANKNLERFDIAVTIRNREEGERAE